VPTKITEITNKEAKQNTGHFLIFAGYKSSQCWYTDQPNAGKRTKPKNQTIKPMKKKSFLITAIALLTFACGPHARLDEETTETVEAVETDVSADVGAGLTSEVHREFLKNLATLCGQSFAGEQIYRSHHGAGWGDMELVMHVTVCEENHIHIPFYVGEDKSRTWMFLVEEDGRLRFRHDHRHPDGTPEDETLYGGYADDNGTAFVQYFPADDYTGQLIEGGAGNLWTVMISEDLSTFTYMLERDGEMRFRLDFDLTVWL
jgi:hypothetical protein